MTVLPETKTIDGVECRVVLDREEKNGKPVEITRDYYAIDRTTGDVYYFGEEVDIYKRGKVVSHEGSVAVGQGRREFGLMMPGKITVGDRFMQERAPKQRALDRSEVIAVGETVVTPAGRSKRFTCAIQARSRRAPMTSGMPGCRPGEGREGRAGAGRGFPARQPLKAYCPNVYPSQTCSATTESRPN